MDISYNGMSLNFLAAYSPLPCLFVFFFRWATRHVGSSQTGARTRVPCIGRRIPNHLCHQGSPENTFLIKVYLPRICSKHYTSNEIIETFLLKLETRQEYILQGFPGGAVVENLPANPGDMGSSPGLGRSHMRQSD